jgi:hypothetical protein
MIFATTLTETAIKPRLFAEKGANSDSPEPVKCTKSELEHQAFKGSLETLQGQGPAQILCSPPPYSIPSSQPAAVTPKYCQCFLLLLSLCQAMAPSLGSFLPHPPLTPPLFQTPPICDGFQSTSTLRGVSSSHEFLYLSASQEGLLPALGDG